MYDFQKISESLFKLQFEFKVCVSLRCNKFSCFFGGGGGVGQEGIFYICIIWCLVHGCF